MIRALGLSSLVHLGATCVLLSFAPFSGAPLPGSEQSLLETVLLTVPPEVLPQEAISRNEETPPGATGSTTSPFGEDGLPPSLASATARDAGVSARSVAPKQPWTEFSVIDQRQAPSSLDPVTPADTESPDMQSRDDPGSVSRDGQVPGETLEWVRVTGEGAGADESPVASVRIAIRNHFTLDERIARATRLAGMAARPANSWPEPQWVSRSTPQFNETPASAPSRCCYRAAGAQQRAATTSPAPGTPQPVRSGGSADPSQAQGQRPGEHRFQVAGGSQAGAVEQFAASPESAAGEAPAGSQGQAPWKPIAFRLQSQGASPPSQPRQPAHASPPTTPQPAPRETPASGPIERSRQMMARKTSPSSHPDTREQEEALALAMADRPLPGDLEESSTVPDAKTDPAAYSRTHTLFSRVRERLPSSLALQRDSDNGHGGGNIVAVLDQGTLPRGEYTDVSSREHPYAKLIQLVDDHLRQNWTIPLDARAFLLHGETVVSFRITPAGRVLDIEIVRHSENPDLDISVLSAIPARIGIKKYRKILPRKGLRLTYHFLVRESAQTLQIQESVSTFTERGS